MRLDLRLLLDVVEILLFVLTVASVRRKIADRCAKFCFFSHCVPVLVHSAYCLQAPFIEIDNKIDNLPVRASPGI